MQATLNSIAKSVSELRKTYPMSLIGKIRALAAIATLFGIGLATYGILNFTPSGPGFVSPDDSYNPYGGGPQVETKHSYGAHYGESAKLQVAFGAVSVVLGIILWGGVAPRYDRLGPTKSDVG
jgi:hypothetical protein